MNDNKCLLQLLNNRRLTTIQVADILDYTYAQATLRIKNSDFSIVEARIVAKHMNIPLEDFADILDGDKEVLKKYLL